MEKDSKTLLHEIHRKDQAWRASLSLMIMMSLFGIFWIIFLNYQTNVKQGQTLEALKTVQDSQAKTLDQLLGLGGTIKDTTQESGAHIDCIAQLFAKFTRDQKPITIVSLDACQAQATIKAQQSSPPVSQSGNSVTQPAPSTTQSSNSNTQSPPPTPKSNPFVDGAKKALKATEDFIRSLK